MKLNDELRHQLEERLLEKAIKDPDFRALLLVDPRRAIEMETSLVLGNDLSLQVVEESPSKIFLVLPAQAPACSDEDLSEQDLQGIAAAGRTNACTHDLQCIHKTMNIRECGF